MRIHCQHVLVAVHAQFVVPYSFYAGNIVVICVVAEDDICICHTDVTSRGQGLTAFPIVGWLVLHTVRSTAMFCLDVGVFKASLTARRPVMLRTGAATHTQSS